MSLLLAQSGHSLRCNAMSAFGGKADIGWRSLNGRAARKRAAKKNCGHRRGLFFALSKLSKGAGGGLYAVFPDRWAILLFHAAQAPLRVSHSSGQAVFLGQLGEEGAIYAQSSSRGSGKWRQLTTSKWSVRPPKNAQLL